MAVDPERDIRGHNWENGKDPKYEENKKCGKQGQGGGHHSDQLPSSTRLTQGSSRFRKSNIVETSWRYSLKEKLVKILMFVSELDYCSHSVRNPGKNPEWREKVKRPMQEVR